jgi:hypothetical protein
VLSFGKLTLGLAENEIVGEALVALNHDELKEMGITSVGHRLTLLKSVYDIKVKQDIPIDTDHYIPLCACPTFLSLEPSRGGRLSRPRRRCDDRSEGWLIGMTLM